MERIMRDEFRSLGKEVPVWLVQQEFLPAIDKESWAQRARPAIRVASPRIYATGVEVRRCAPARDAYGDLWTLRNHAPEAMAASNTLPCRNKPNARAANSQCSEPV